MSGRRNLALAMALAVAAPALAGDPARPCPPGYVPLPPVCSLDDLARMTPEQLDLLYSISPAAGVPCGKVKGRPLVDPGSSLAVPASRAGRLLWQGKIFDPAGATAVNRFAGFPFIRGRLYQGTSWFDGRPSLILDYAEMSRVYQPYRDEIREVAPGLYLGRMYDRRTAPPEQVLLFALDATGR